MHDSMEQGGASVCVCGGVHASVCGWGRGGVKERISGGGEQGYQSRAIASMRREWEGCINEEVEGRVITGCR